jgi:hypothetical protein
VQPSTVSAPDATTDALDELRVALRSQVGVNLPPGEEADALAYMLRNKLRPDNPLVMAFVDLLRVRAEIAERVELAVAGGVERGVTTALDGARRTARAPSTPIAIRPTAAAALYAAVLALVVAIACAATWSVTASNDRAAFRANAPQLGAFLATPGGRAAAELLHANGDALAGELQRCHRYTDRGRPAMTCTFWSTGYLPSYAQGPGAIALEAAAHAPAWPLVILLLVATPIALALRRRPKGDAWS